MNTQPELAEQLENVIVPDAFKAVQSRTGKPVLRVGSITYHSMYDPEAEGRRFAERVLEAGKKESGGTIAIFGLGFGYHVKGLCCSGCELRIIEPSLETVKFAMQHVDLEEIFKNATIDTHTDVTNADEEHVVYHQPSLKYSKSFFENEAEHNRSAPETIGANVPARQKNSLRILVVSPIYGGSLPIAGYCERSLKKLGHDVQLFDSSMFERPFRKTLAMKIDTENAEVLNRLFLHILSEMIVATCHDYKPDIVLALSQAPVSKNALERISANGIVTAYWFVEDFNYMTYWQQYAPLYDCYFTIQDGTFFQELKKAGCRNFSYLPLAADPMIHGKIDLSSDERREYGSDISFMGAGYFNRQKLFMGLMDYDFKIWGNEWDIRSPLWQIVQRNGSRVSTEDAVKIFNATRVNINLHSSACINGVCNGDFINPRTFEIASCGAFQLVDRREYLQRHFAIGSEIETYQDIEELRHKIDYYLKNDYKRIRMAERAAQRVSDNHTYIHRMSELISVVRSVRPDAFYAKSAGAPLIVDAEMLREEFPETAPLIDDLVRCSGELDIDSIAASIHSKAGPLNQSDALLLLIKEYQNFVEEQLQ